MRLPAFLDLNCKFQTNVPTGTNKVTRTWRACNLLETEPDQRNGVFRSGLILPISRVRIMHFLLVDPVNQLPVRVLWLFKQLEVQPDHDLSCGNLVEQQPLRDRSFRALVFLYIGQPDLGPAQEVWRVGGRGEKKTINKWMYRYWRTGSEEERYRPSGENWSLSNTVTQRTSCSRSFMKNWQLEFHFGFRVSCANGTGGERQRHERTDTRGQNFMKEHEQRIKKQTVTQPSWWL